MSDTELTSEEEHMVEEVTGLFEDMPEDMRAETLHRLMGSYCVGCGKELPEDEDEPCPCEDEEDDEEDDEDGDDGDPDSDDEDDEDGEDPEEDSAEDTSAN